MKFFSCHAHSSLLILFLATMFLACGKEDDLAEYGITKGLADFRSSTIASVNYDLSFHIPLNQEDSIMATEIVSFDFKDGAKDFILDFDAPRSNLHYLEINGKESTGVFENNHIVIDEALLRTKGNKLVLKFKAGDQSLNRNKDYLYTLFVPARASTCFPVIDQPDVKANYTLALDIPFNWKALANGTEKSVKTDNDRRLIQFEPTLKISSYLFAFVVGDFDIIEKEIDGNTMRMFHRETDSVKLHNSVNTIFDWHAKSLKWLERYTKIDYPFPKFDFALIPAFQYGGMEHPGAIFYKASSLLLDDNPTINQEISRGRLIAHETAHMWFGDLVTMSWFDDVWLKEVFANFMAAKIINPSFPEIDHDLKFLLGHYPSAYAIDRTEGTHAIAQNLDNLYDAGSLYGSIIYQKAPIVMRKLEDEMGEETLRTGLQEYLSTHKFGNASWKELIDILSEVSGKNLKRWNKSWVETPGMPIMVVNVRERNGKMDRLSLFQVNGESVIWPQDYLLEIGNDSLTITRAVEFQERVHNLKDDSLLNPTFVFPNAKGNAYGYFKMGRSTKKHYFEHINTIEHAAYRAALWLSLYENMLNQNIGPTNYVEALMKSLPLEKNPLIINYLNRSIETVYWKFLDDKQRLDYAARIEGVLFNQALNASDDGVRSGFFKSFYRIVSTPEGLKLLEKIWKGEVDMNQFKLSESDQINMAYELSLKLNDDAYLLTQMDKLNNQDRVNKMKFVAPALSPNRQKRDEFFKSLMDEKNRHTEDWVLTALSYLHHPLRQHESIAYLNESLLLLESIKLTGDIFFPKRWLDNTFKGHNSSEAADVVRQFLYRNHNYPLDLKNKILQSTDMLFRAERVFEQSAQDE